MFNEKISVLEIVIKKFVNLPDNFEKGFILGYMEGVQSKQPTDVGQGAPDMAGLLQQKTA